MYSEAGPQGLVSWEKVPLMSCTLTAAMSAYMYVLVYQLNCMVGQTDPWPFGFSLTIAH